MADTLTITNELAIQTVRDLFDAANAVDDSTEFPSYVPFISGALRAMGVQLSTACAEQGVVEGPRRVTYTPVIDSPILVAATHVSGTSTEPSGTVIEVFRDAVSQGTTTVTSGAWDKTSLSAMVEDQVITAVGTAPGRYHSEVATPVTVTAPA